MATLELVQDLLIGVGQAQFYLRRDATHSDLLIPRRNPLLKIRAVHGEKAVIPGETRVVCKKNKMPQLLPLEVNNINKRPKMIHTGQKRKMTKTKKEIVQHWLPRSLSLSRFLARTTNEPSPFSPSPRTWLVGRCGHVSTRGRQS